MTDTMFGVFKQEHSDEKEGKKTASHSATRMKREIMINCKHDVFIALECNATSYSKLYKCGNRHLYASV